MPGGQAITSGQGVVTQEEALPIAGIALVSGAGTIVADAQAGIDLSGSVATLALGTAVSGPIIFLRSRKVGGGSATAVLLGGSGVLSQGSVAQGSGKTPTGALLTGFLGTFAKTRSRALSGTAISGAQGGLIAQAGPGILSATILASGSSISLVFSQTVTFGAGGNGGVVVGMSGGASAATYASGQGTETLVYNLARTINQGETGTIAYTQPGNGIEATAGSGDVVSFSGVPVTNSSTQTGGNPTMTTVLQWNAVPGATSYRIYRGTTSGVHPNNWNVGNVTEYDVNLLTPKMVFSTTYYFAIAAIDGGGEGAKSTQILVRNWALL